MKRNKFNLSYTRLLTCNMGQLVPVGVTEVLPGDSFQHAASAFIRAAPLATPPMHPVKIALRHFFVPHRLVWDQWEDFITGGPDGMDASVFPTITVSDNTEGSLLDYLGIPPFEDDATEFSALPVRAYQLIFNEFYRDQDLVAPANIFKGGGNDAITDLLLKPCAWEKDYFTTCRPWEQKGPVVTLPIGQEATGVSTTQWAGVVGDPTQYNLVPGPSDVGTWTSVDVDVQPFPGGTMELRGDVTVDLTTATAATVNQLRLALALQRYEEARARYGSRYTEYLRYLGVRSSDARLQRPEYLGGGVTNLQFSEVLATAASSPGPNETEGVGSLAGHGIGLNRTNRYRRFFEEHGFVISVMHVIPQTMYPQGLFRHWNRRTKEDFWQKELEHIGQQAVLNKEVYALGTVGNDTFGYQDRYDEYRRAESSVHGEFRSVLSDWHFARTFDVPPVLNASFVQADPSVDPFQAQENNTLYCAVRHQLVARRMIARQGNSLTL